MLLFVRFRMGLTELMRSPSPTIGELIAVYMPLVMLIPLFFEEQLFGGKC